MAELFGSADLIGRLTGMLENAEAKAQNAVDALRAGLLAVLEARGMSWSDGDRRRVVACEDPGTLPRWLLRAATAKNEASILD